MHSDQPSVSGGEGGSDVSGGPSGGGSLGSTGSSPGSAGGSGGGSRRHSHTIAVMGVPFGPSSAVNVKLADVLGVRPPPGGGPTGPVSSVVVGASRSGGESGGASPGEHTTPTHCC